MTESRSLLARLLPARPLRSGRRWRTLAWIAATALVVLLAVYVVVAGQLLTLLEQRRAAVAAWVGARVGMQVEIDRIDTGMRLLTPVVHLAGVRIYVPGSPEPVLAAPAIDLEVDTAGSLLARRPVLRLLRIQGIDLTLEEGADGRFRVRGMPFNVNDPEAEQKLRLALETVYRQTDILVERSRLTVSSARLPVTALEKLRLHIHNDGDRHAVSGSAQVEGPGRLAVSFVLNFSGQPLVPRDLAGDLYVRVLPASVEDWLPRRDAGGLWIDALAAGGEAWLHVAGGRVESAVGRAQVDSLAVSLEDGRKLEGLMGLATRFRWQARPQGGSLALAGLSFRRQGASWPETDAALAWQRDAGGNLQWQGMLARADLRMLAGLAEVLPPEQAALVSALAPTGSLADVHIAWAAGAPDSAPHWQASANFANLGVRSATTATGRVLPGLSNASGRLELQPDAGYLDLQMAGGRFDLPTHFGNPLTLDEARLRAVWRRDAAGWQVSTDRFTLRNADAQASGLATLRLPGGDASPRLSFLGLIENGRGKAASRYMPLTMSEGGRRWLAGAVIDGRLRRGSVLFEGPLRRDPASLRERTSQTRWQGDGIQLAFLAGWPALRGADADVWIANGRLEATAREGRLLDSVVRDIRVAMSPSAATPGAPQRLTVRAQVDGDVADAFRLFRDTPLREVVPAELLRWDGSGRLAATVDVSTVLGGAPPRVTVEGRVSGSNLASAAHALEISDASGALRYDTVDGFSADELRGRGLDSDFTGSARTVTTGGRQTTRIDLRGRLHMTPVSAWLKLPALDLLRGEADSALQLRFERGGESVLEVRSNLRGIASSAPPPLAKAAEGVLDTRLVYTLGTDTPRLLLQAGRQFAADIRLRNGVPQGGVVAVGSTRLPEANGEQGLVVEGSLPTLVLDDWLTFSRRLAGIPPAPAGVPFTVSRAVSGLVGLGGTVQRINVRATRVDAFGFPLDEATLRMQRGAESWVVRVDSRSLAGQLVLPDGYQERGEKPLVIQIDRLALPAGGGTVLNPSALQPAAVPRLALALNDISIGSEKYGSWSLEAFPEGNAVRLADVHGSWRALDIGGQGRWEPAPEGGLRTTFTGLATADDLARVSTAFGFAPNLSSSAARIRFDVAWPGNPLQADPLTARGTLDVDVRDGRFVTQSAKTQALRAFGVFNIGTWQRRMKLDFSDLYRKGVAFDTLTGQLALEAGKLSTANLLVEGPSAVFEASGRADLANQVVNGRVLVTLPVNSNLYVGCLAGLPACAGIVAVEQLWGDRLEKMTTLVYDVDGVWEDPKISQLEGDAARAVVEAAAERTRLREEQRKRATENGAAGNNGSSNGNGSNGARAGKAGKTTDNSRAAAEAAPGNGR